MSDAQAAGHWSDGTPWATETPDWLELFDLVYAAPAWHADAACKEHPEVSFFPEQGASATPARRVCAGCLVRDECRAWAAKQDLRLSGIWGGLSQRQRVSTG